MIKELIKLSTHLDNKGYYREANYVDEMIRKEAEYGAEYGLEDCMSLTHNRLSKEFDRQEYGRILNALYALGFQYEDLRLEAWEESNMRVLCGDKKYIVLDMAELEKEIRILKGEIENAQASEIMSLVAERKDLETKYNKMIEDWASRPNSSSQQASPGRPEDTGDTGESDTGEANEHDPDEIVYTENCSGPYGCDGVVSSERAKDIKSHWFFDEKYENVSVLNRWITFPDIPGGEPVTKEDRGWGWIKIRSDGILYGDPTETLAPISFRAELNTGIPGGVDDLDIDESNTTLTSVFRKGVNVCIAGRTTAHKNLGAVARKSLEALGFTGSSSVCPFEYGDENFNYRSLQKVARDLYETGKASLTISMDKGKLIINWG